jgi:hypothetical protein
MDATVNRYSHHIAVLLPSIGDFDVALALNW